MIHPTRTNLLLLKEKSRSVQTSTGILKARRQALIRELLATNVPYLKSRDQVRTAYRHALREWALCLAIEGPPFLDSLEAVAKREVGLEIVEKSIMGLRYREVIVRESSLREIDGRGYDYVSTSPRLEQALHLFEQLLAAMLEIAAYESKLKRLGAEVSRVTRRIRVLEERTLPELRRRIRSIAQFLGERERESTFRLKRFRESRMRER